ncbi:MAG TPA: large conductance mechanosensitive channel protein MscL [Candidatus Limnocylindria bacterium]|nr:large conductance mechanosensitive channel protein MscL [Candidatus Limnocylindria bacterium]
MWAEFKEFLLKANVLALALAFIVGVALAAVVTSLVNDIIMPPIGMALGGVDFQSMFIDLSGKHYPTLKAAKEAGAAVIAYGSFINSIITFVIVAFVAFLIARALVKTTVATKACPRCAMDIPIPATRCPHCTSELGAAARTA